MEVRLEEAGHCVRASGRGARVWDLGSSPVRGGALTTGWQVGTEVNRKPMTPTQSCVVGQRGTQARLPAAAGIPAALFQVGHRAEI